MGKKWNPDTKPSEKLLAMYTMLLFSRKEASLSELAIELKCSKQTVLRLIDQMEASHFGKIIHSKRGRESMYMLARPKELPKLSLDAEGLQQLALCRDFMLHLLPESMRKNIDATLQQATAYLSHGEDPKALFSVGGSFAKGHIDYSPFQDIFTSIIKAIDQKKVCTVQYRSSLHRESTTFAFAPKRLVAYREAIHIHGWIVSDQGSALPLYEKPTNLALHRMQKVLLTRRNAGHIPDVKEKNQDAFGLIEDQPFSVQVMFSPSAASYVAERKWSAGQKVTLHKDGSLTLTMTTHNTAEVISWVLSFADTAELLSPQWLRDELEKRIATLWSKYSEQKTD